MEIRKDNCYYSERLRNVFAEKEKQMSKSVLVIDTPDSCDKCKIRAINLAWCNVARKSTSHYTNGKPIDERKKTRLVSSTGAVCKKRSDGDS